MTIFSSGRVLATDKITRRVIMGKTDVCVYYQLLNPLSNMTIRYISFIRCKFFYPTVVFRFAFTI